MDASAEVAEFISIPQVFAFVKTALSTRKFPQKCWSTVKDKVEKSTKTAKVEANILAKTFFIYYKSSR